MTSIIELRWKFTAGTTSPPERACDLTRAKSEKVGQVGSSEDGKNLAQLLMLHSATLKL
jgi:hypothetical protein